MCDHFKGKEAIQHIVEVQASGVVASAEIHGAETPGFLFAATDAARETAVALLLISIILSYFEFALEQVSCVLISFSCAWIAWKLGRASWLAWSRLERLHRVMDEERHEIEYNRAQEKEELKALYQAKGFQGKLLDDVVDVLMADGDRTLRVMLEEELGFRLEENDHPLAQGVGAGIGALLAAVLVIVAHLFTNQLVLFLSVGLIFGLSCYLTAKREHNRIINAIVWNVGLGLFAYLVAFFSMQFIASNL